MTSDLTTDTAAVPIGRMIGGAVLGYTVSTLIVVITTVVLAGVLGPDGVFEPGTYRSKPDFEYMNLGAGFAAAALGGAVAWAIGRRIGVAIMLAAILVGGMLSGIMALRTQSERTTPYEPRAEGSWVVAMDRAEANSQRSATYLLGMPVAGALGLLAGAFAVSRVSRPKAPQA